AAAEFVGLTGSPQAVTLLVPLLHHTSEFVREAALLGLAEAGGRETARPAMPALKDESVAVRSAAVRTIAAAGDAASSTVLIRRVEQEPDEGVQAELLRAIGRLGAKEALEVLARFAEPGGMMHRRSATVRAAAVDGPRQDARGAHGRRVPAHFVLAHPVHTRSAARGRDRYHGVRPAVAGVLREKGAAVREPRARGRNQPRPR